MSEKKAYLEDYYQLGNGDPADSYEPGESKQRIDLTEYYKETGQDEATVMVMGVEAFNLGKISRDLAIKLNLKDARTYDPFASERNARTGQEGFFGTVYDKFKEFIEAIIKYIRMAIDWVVDTVKGIFGFRKSARITKAIDDDLEAMREEFVKTMNGLGFPGAEYNVEDWLGNLPPGQDRQAQLMLLKSKFVDDQEAIKGLAASIPLLQQCVAKMKQAGDKTMITSKVLKKVISEEFNRTRARSQVGAGQVPANESTEVNRIAKACKDVTVSLDVPTLADLVGKVYAELYKIEFSNDELTNGFSDVRKKLQESITAEMVQLKKQNIGQTMTDIQYLNKRYQEMSDKEIDLSKVNWKAMGQIVDKSDSEKVTAISGYYNYPNLTGIYQGTVVELRNFTNFCYSASNELMKVEKQIENLVAWHNRTHAYYYAGVMKDVDKVIEMVAEARKAGHNPMAGIDNIPVGLVFIKDADAKTFAEKLSANVNFLIEQDVAGVKTSINNFSKQIGWGKTV